MSRLAIDPQHARYQSKGAVITLQQLLIQRHAARTLEYLMHSRSIAGISGLHLSKIRGRGIDFEEFSVWVHANPHKPATTISTALLPVGRE